jgi:hypothetical protein
VAEWPNASVLKTEDGVIRPWVRILPLPKISKPGKSQAFLFSEEERAKVLARVRIRRDANLANPPADGLQWEASESGD